MRELPAPRHERRPEHRHGNGELSRGVDARAQNSFYSSRDQQQRRSPSPLGYNSRRNGRSRSGRRERSPHRQQVPLRNPPLAAAGYAYGEGRRVASAVASSASKPSAKSTGYAYGEGRRAAAVPIGYAYGEGRRAATAEASTALNGRSCGQAGRQAATPRNALIPVGRRPCVPARLTNIRAAEREWPGTQQSGSYSYSREDAVSSDSSSSGAGSEEEEEEEVKAKPEAKTAGGKDEIVHFDWRPGMVLNLKYELIKALGDGTFGRVVLAHDRRDDRQVAIKIIRDVKRYLENAKIEADILKDVRKADPRGKSRCLIMHETFTHERKFFCLVSEPLGVSLYDFMKKNAFRGFWMQDIQSFAKQCMQAMCFLHSTLRLAHTDLKPENILLQSLEPPCLAQFSRESEWKARKHSSREPPPYLRPASSQIKIIDFGNATYESEHHSSIINTRQYRGPEVVLEMEWNELSDIWSLGCIFLELYTGELLFGTHDNFEHLALMEKILQPLPASVLDATLSQVKEKYLQQGTTSWRLNWPSDSVSPASELHVRSARPLPEIVKDPAHKPFLVCATSMLTADAKLRPSAAKVLQDPFFQAKFED